MDGIKEPERWQEIVDTAARIIGERGYKRASVRLIAEDLGLLQGSLYHYVSSKEDLLYAVIRRFHDLSWANMEVGRGASQSPLECISAVVEGHVLLCTAHRVDAAVFYREFRGLREDRRAEIMAWRHRYESSMKDLIKSAMLAGEVPSGTHAHVATMNILNMTNSVFLWYRPDGGNAPEDIAATFSTLAVRGLRTPPVIPGRAERAREVAPAASGGR